MTPLQMMDVYNKCAKTKEDNRMTSFDRRDDILQEVAIAILTLPESQYETWTEEDATKYIFSLINRFDRRLAEEEQAAKFISADLTSQFPVEGSVWEPAHTEAYSELRELKERVTRWALKRIPARHATMLRFVHDNRSIAQFARREQMEYNAARQLHHRAKKSLQKEFEIAKVPDCLWRLGESDKMSSEILRWLVEGPHSADILCTEIAAETSTSVPNSDQLSDLIDDAVDRLGSIDHSSADSDRLYSALQNGGQYEDDPF